MDVGKAARVFQALEKFRIELPSWGFANTGTRFGKCLQPAAASTAQEKLSDAGQVHRLTGVCPSVALHVLWDFPRGVASTDEIRKLAAEYGYKRARSIPICFRISTTNTDRSAIPIPPSAKPLCNTLARASKSPAGWKAGTSRCGSPTVPTIPAPPTSASASNGSRRT